MTDLQYPLSANVGRHIRSKRFGTEGEIIDAKGLRLTAQFKDGSRIYMAAPCLTMNYVFIEAEAAPSNVVSIVPIINRKRIAVVSVGGPDDGPRVA